jgi:translation elongation factor EF-Ts
VAAEPVRKGADVNKIVEGKVKKRLSELCLLHQPHMVEAGAPVIEKHLAAVSAKIGSPLTVRSFALWAIGDRP